MAEHSGVPVAGLQEPGTSGPTPPSNVNWDRLDALLEDLPPGIPLLPPEDAGNFEKYTHRPRHAYVPGDGWKNCARALEKYDAELCKGYREEIDTLLVFAGLFSAVVTAFTIESYQWLQADPNDAIIVLLSQIAQSVSRNNTVAPPVPAAAGLAGSVSVRINVYWFLALALSLSAALVSILCKQWIREFERNIGLSPEDFVAVHQTKLEGLEKGKVGEIIALLPLLLQLALALFALGVLELLWQLHSAIAAVVCVPTVVAFAFYAATTFLPAVSYRWQISFDCPYKSPQAILAFPAYGFYMWMRGTATAGLSYLRSLTKHYLTVLFCAQPDVPFPLFDGRAIRRWYCPAPEWHVLSQRIEMPFSYYQRDWPLSVYRSLRWMHLNLDDGDVRERIWHCLWEMALAHDPDAPGVSEDDLKRGFRHVEAGTADVPQSGLRALALAYLVKPGFPRDFLVEALIQNLSNMDAASAEYLIRRMAERSFFRSLGAELILSIIRAVSAYGRLHVQGPIGGFLVHLAQLALFMSPCDPQLRRVLLGHATLLYHTWLGVQPLPHQLSTVESMEEILLLNCNVLFADPEEYALHPELLRQRICAQELAELLRVYAQSHEDPAATLGARMFPDSQEEIRPIVRALLKMAQLGQDTETAAGDGALVLDTATSPPLPHAGPPPGPTLHAQSRAHVTEGGPSCSPSPRRHGARGTLAHARSSDTQLGHSPALDESLAMEGERHGVSGRLELRDSPTLRADAIHAPSAGRVQTRPLGNNADAVHCADGEGDREAGGSAGGMDAASSAGAEVEGAPDDSGSHGSASLRAVIIHSPSRAGAQEPAGNQEAVRLGPLDPGEDRESRIGDDRGMDESVLQL